MGSPRELDEAVAALVDELRDPTESIWHWHRSENGNVSVLLIDRHRIAHAKRMIEVGLGGGEGRSIEFRKAGDRWALVGQGRWVG